MTSLTGALIGTLPYERMDINVLEDTPEMFQNAAQPVLEAMLTTELERAGTGI